MTNCPWVLSAPRLRAALRLDDVRLLNDFGAQAMAVTLLGDDDVSAIGSPGWSPAGRDADPQADRTYAVLGPGTGLGVGALLRRRGHWHALQTEGGHAGFAPVGAGEIAVLQVLSAQFGRVSNERLVSGMGLANLHRALSVLAGEPPSALRPEQVTAAAEAGDPRSRRVLDIFCAVFGGCAGDLVLTLGAWDGVFLAGGLVPRLLPVLRQSAFRERFVAKGRYSAAMAAVPALAVLHPQPGLLGAAALARQAAAPAG